MDKTSNSARLRTIAGAAGALLIIGGSASAAIAAPLPEGAVAPLGMCTPDGGFPSIDGTTPAEPQIVDTGVNTYAGGDLTVGGGAAEAEGLVVVAGDLHVEKSFVVGIAIGSDMRPAPGDSMLQVGGDVTIVSGSTLNVGDFAVPGGAVSVGGTAPTAQISNAGAEIRTGIGADALDPYADFTDRVAAWSAGLAAEDANGAVSFSSGWAVLELTGTGVDELQVFEVTAQQLTTANEIRFSGIDPFAPVLVNVVGGPVTATASTYYYNGSVLTMTGPDDGNIAASILWNYTDADAVEIGGTGQAPGSILAPTATVDITANTNGRVYVGGDLTTRGQGNELHSYPWAGTCDDDEGGDADAAADADGAGADADADGAGADADGAGADADADGSDAAADAAGADADAAAEGVGTGADAGAADAAAGAGAEGVTTADAGSAASDGAADTTQGLATTGGELSPLVMSAAAALLIGGAALAVIRRRRLAD